MAFKDTIVEFIIKGRDLFSPAADKAAASAEQLEKSSKALNDELTNIEGLQAQTKRYSELSASLGKTEQAYKDVSLSLNNQLQQQKQAKTDLKAAQTAYDNVKKSLAALEAEQKQSNSTSDQTNRALAQKRDELNKLELEYKQAVTTNAQYNLQVKETRSEVNKLGTTFNKNKAELAALDKSLSKANINLNELGNESKQLEQRQNAAKVAIAGVNNRLEKQQAQLAASSRTTAQYGGSIRQATKDLVLMAGAYVGLDKVKDSLFSILNAGDEAKAFSAQMTAMMGSIASGEQATAWIKDFANNTGTRLDAAKQAFASLKTFGIDPMSGAMQSLIDYNAKLGGNQEKLEGIVLAVGQAWAKQKLQGEEILQLVERGVPVWDLLAKVTGKNSVELQKMSEKGQLSRETIKALFDEMGKQASGQAAKSLERLSGQINLMGNKWDEFKIKIADSGVYQVAIDFMNQLNAQFDKLVADGSIDRAAQKISEFFSAIITDGGASVKSLLDNINGFVTGAERVVGAVRIVWNGFSAGVKTVALVVVEQAAMMVSAMASVLDVVGADELAQKAQYQADALKAVSQGFYDSILQDGQELSAAWQQLTQTTQDTVKTAYQASTAEVKTATDSQKEAVKTVTDTTAQAVVDIGLMMSKAGIITTDSLKSTEAAAKDVYDVLLARYKETGEGLYELEQAYSKWAQAAVKTADATKSTVPANVEAAASALGLTDELNKLIATAAKLAPVNDINSDAVNRFTAEIETSNKAIAANEAVLASSTATAEQKAQAQALLVVQQARLADQTGQLLKVQELEKANLYQLQREQGRLTFELERLNQSYQTGALTAEEYTYRKEQLSEVLDVVNNLLGDFKSAQDDATNATRQGTQATREQVKANQDSVRSLRDNKRELDNVSRAYNNAAINASRYSASQGASVDKVVDYQEKNQSAYQVDSKEIQAEKERREHEAMQNRTFEKFANAIKNASTINEINTLFNKINKQLIYVSLEQKKQLNDALNAQKSVIAGQSNRSSNSSGSNSNGGSSRSGSNRTNTPSTRSPAGGGGGGGDGGQNYNSAALMGAINQLTTAVSALNAQQKTTPTKASKVVRLELAVPGGEVMSAELLGEFQEQFMQKLEQLSQTQ
ncbi:tape measure protein [Pseudoalteromonas ulvae]|uniref:Tape measure protein N-terminal domain-containing protein n=1 Tax=Pseudoalteromonas ulvae TaxID=107327 RepID=A0A244CUH7_PSEDV|nr:tape measure protein [Pseudoalteromonas ulvae]OUL59267.1 hypothetical protein B1199_03080 [Pseudoalteromonas ulvae]